MKRMKNNYMTLALLATFSFFVGLSTIQAQETPFLQFGGKDTVKKEGPAVKKTSLWSKAVTTPWIINFGPVDIVDNDEGAKGLFKIWDNKNYYPLSASVEKYLFKGISIQGVVSSETINIRHFTSIQANIKYNLKELIGDTKWFDPYAVLGGSYTRRRFPHGQHLDSGVDRSLNINVGGGLNLWVFPNTGVFAQTLAQFNLLPSRGGSNFMQYSFGVVFKIGRGVGVSKVEETKVIPSNYKRSKEAEDAANYLRDILNKK
jgi:hypothetical protein